MKFEMNELEVTRAREWVQKQIEKAKGDGKPRDCTGFRFGYLFYPTGLGPCVRVRDSHTGEEADVTDLDNF